MGNSLDQVFEDAGREWNVDPRLLRSVMIRESGGNPNAVSPKGATGLMQIMPPTGADLGVTNLRDPVQSIFGGAKYLGQLLYKYPRPELAIAAYNAGPGRVDAWMNGKASLPDETAAYVPKVLNTYRSAKSTAQGVPSDEDFLKATAQPAAKTALPPDEDFLKATGAAAAPAQPPAEAPQNGPTAVDDLGRPIGQALPAVAPTAPPAASAPPVQAGGPVPPPTGQAVNPERPGILAAMASPFTEGGPLGPDTSTGTFYNGPMGLVNRLAVATPLAALDLAGRGASSVARGVGAAGNALISTLSPGSSMGNRFERDIGNLPNALAGMVGEGAPRAPEMPVNKLAGATKIADDLEHAIATDVRGPARGAYLNDLLVNAIRKADEPTAAPVPAEAGAYGGDPRSMGAAGTPNEIAAVPRSEMIAGRATAEHQKLNEPQPQGMDAHDYVPGVNPTEAQMVQTARKARDEKLTASEMPDGFKANAAANNEARINYYDDLAGTRTLAKRLVDDRAEQAQKDLTAAFANKQAADATPVAQTAAEILASPDGKRPVVQNAVKSVLDQMTDAKGNLETDPEMLYGVRKHIDDLMSKEAARDNPASVRASAQLQQLKGVLDQTIEQAAPGFRQYLDNFAQASRPIDEMRVLQEYRPKLFNANNQMTYSGVQRMMKDLVTARSNTRGVDATHSISDETMQRLWNLRDDLRRVASADDLARAKGSDTAQNAMDIAKSFAKQGVMHGAANYMAPGVGSLVVNMVNNKLRQAAVSKAADRALNPAINRLAPPQMRD